MNQAELHKNYEKQYNHVRLSGEHFVICRIDGRNFHKFCKDMERPFDQRLIQIFGTVTQQLVEMTNATCGYTQSDEISLLWSPQRDVFFDGKHFKMTSVIASLVTGLFNQQLWKHDIDKLATFDTRVWEIPTSEHVLDYFLWRMQDCQKNSISMLASQYFSHDELFNIKTSERLNLLESISINWTEMNSKFKWGQFAIREKILVQGGTEDLPEKHQYKCSDHCFERNIISLIELETSQLTELKQILFENKNIESLNK